jgi:hypothetical protein
MCTSHAPMSSYAHSAFLAFQDGPAESWMPITFRQTDDNTSSATSVLDQGRIAPSRFDLCKSAIRTSICLSERTAFFSKSFNKSASLGLTVT